MGAELGELFTALSAELQWMFIRWLQFRKLYVEKESRLEILNRSAPFFFWVVQQVLWDDTVLGIARLGGPPKSAGKPQLALARLVPLLDDPGLKGRIVDQLATIDGKIDRATEWRHRHIAHRELSLALGRSPTELPGIAVEQIDELLDLMAAVLNDILNFYSRTTTAYRHASTIQDADDLLFVLRDGLRREEIRTRRLDEGRYDAEDWDDDAPPV